MRLNKTGRITDNFYVAGHPAMPVYLMDGQTPVLFDAGLWRDWELNNKGVSENPMQAFGPNLAQGVGGKPWTS
ncbi:MAG: hypothetical protein R6U38_13900 [Desulfatiglandaceae bacterium]